MPKTKPKHKLKIKFGPKPNHMHALAHLNE